MFFAKKKKIYGILALVFNTKFINFYSDEFSPS